MLRAPSMSGSSEPLPRGLLRNRPARCRALPGGGRTVGATPFSGRPPPLPRLWEGLVGTGSCVPPAPPAQAGLTELRSPPLRRPQTWGWGRAGSPGQTLVPCPCTRPRWQVPPGWLSLPAFFLSCSSAPSLAAHPHPWPGLRARAAQRGRPQPSRPGSAAAGGSVRAGLWKPPHAASAEGGPRARLLPSSRGSRARPGRGSVQSRQGAEGLRRSLS